MELNSSPLLTCHNVTLNRGGDDLVRQFSFSVHEGDRVGLIGPNGSGKSTLLHVLGGRRKPEAGTVSLRAGCRIAFIEQSFDVERFGATTVFDYLRAAIPEHLDVELRRGRLEREMNAHCGILESNPARAEDSEWVARLSALQAQLESMAGMEARNIVESALRMARLRHLRDRRIANLSGGERKRLQIVGHLLGDPDIILLDEPTNHLDVETVEWLEEFLLEVAEAGRNLLLGTLSESQHEQVAFIIVSHDRALLDTLVNEVVEIDSGETFVCQGNYEAYSVAKLQRDQNLRTAVSRNANLFRRELAWLRAGVKARTTKQTARIERAQKLEVRLKQDSARARGARNVELQFNAALADSQRDDDGGMLPVMRPLGQQELVRLDEVWVRHPAAAASEGRFVASNLNLVLKPKMRVALLGPNGCGKSTLFHAIRSGERLARGKVTLHELAAVGIFDQEREMLDAQKTVRDELCPKGDFVEVAGRRLHLMAYLDGFLFERRDAVRRVSELSGGEQARLLLAKLMLQEANVLLLDEPTNDLDIRTLQSLEISFSNFPGAVIFTSHDRYFISRVATHVLVWTGETRVGEEVRGTWQMVADLDQALAIIEKSESFTAEEEARSESTESREARNEKESRKEAKRSRAEGARDARELAAVEREIASIELEIGAGQKRLEEAYSEGKRHQETLVLVNAVRALEERLAVAMARWEEIYARGKTE